MRRQVRCRFHSSGRAASRSCTEAAVITTASSRPIASTAMCRFLPLTFFALSHPRVALGTVSAARTDWESITAAVGSPSRPAATRTWARSTSCSRAKVPSSRQAAKYPYTVRQGGKSAGRYRQAHQVRSTYKIASTIARADQMRGLPRRPGTSAGRCGSWGPRQFISTGLAKSAMTGIKAIYQTLTEPSSGWSCAGLAAWCLTGAGIDCRDMRVIVTGGAGFIGSHLTDAFLTRGDDLTVIDDLSAGRPARLDERVALHKLSVTDADLLGQVIDSVGPALICHLAAQIDVRASVAPPAADAQTNVLGTINVLEAARTAQARVLFCSTGGALS